ncbi:hypothetical protein DRJ17_03070 [Candidatus Woesearchaeota archaeon]|mgnify:CR=1 FL=1|nr:MAG: hypothetical protein DRJ17_03070 [Candidatus Woesearchaeota archaeon]
MAKSKNTKKTRKTKKKAKKILIFCAHPDDEVIGAGGAIAHYKKKGLTSLAIIFSYGEGSHPWQKKKFIAKTRVQECRRAGKIIGCEEHVFLGLKDGTLQSGVKKPFVAKSIRKIVEQNKPKKIFTHSKDDPFPDHRAVHRIVSETLHKMKYKCDLYSFDIWNPFNIRSRNQPKLVVDISKEFKDKIKAIKIFKSQKANAIILLTPLIYLRAILNGIYYGYKFAEVFLKIK